MMHRGPCLQDFLQTIILLSQSRPLYQEEAGEKFGPKSGLLEPSKMLSTNSESLDLFIGVRVEQGINLRIINNLQTFYSSP